MRKLIGVVAAVAVLLCSGLLAACGGGADVGISGSNPIGSLAGLEKALAAKGLAKEAGNEGHVAMLFGEWAEGQEVTIYKDGVPGYVHLIAIAHKDGKVSGVTGKYRSGSLVFSTVGTKTETFTAHLWRAVTGADPDFKSLFDQSLNMQEYFLATVTKGKVTCTWRKDSQDQNMKNPRGVVDLVQFRVQ